MGLGLAITYSIISKHDGHITVESEVGVVTTFTVYLPAHEKQHHRIKFEAPKSTLKLKESPYVISKSNLRKLILV